jgi:hypothetical protein
LEQGIDLDALKVPKPGKAHKLAFVKPRCAYSWKDLLRNKAWKYADDVELASKNSATERAKPPQTLNISSPASGGLKSNFTPDDRYEPMRSSLDYPSPATSPHGCPKFAT